MTLLLCALANVGVLTGCGISYADRVKTSRAMFYDGRLESSRREIDEQLKKGRKKEADLLKLEAAMLDLSNGDAKSAGKSLREVRDHFDYFEQKNLAENTLSYWTDDTVTSYAGEDYEKVMIRAMLAIADLIDDGGDAGAYALQVVAKQQQIVENAGKKTMKDRNGNEMPNPKLAYKQVAFGAYLHGLLQEETLTNYDDAVRDYANVLQWQPDFQQGIVDLTRAREGRHHQPGNGVVYVIALVGRGPFKEQVNAEATQTALLIADLVFSATNKYSVPPTLAPVPIPEIRKYFDDIHAVGIYVDGRPASATETVTDIGNMAVDQFKADRDMIIARAVMRRVVKKGTIYAAKKVADVNPWISLAMDAGGVIWEAQEAADTRCWGLLPDRIQVARLELPTGEHTLELQSVSQQGKPLSVRKYPVKINVANGRNTYVFANFPMSELVGKISTNQNR
ncbi:MAG: hypothetical protein FWC50_14885 [Planctomycetaceae bacterium]|nr:hypothetical protein [Planctomycetaceae bacterium]